MNTIARFRPQRVLLHTKRSLAVDAQEQLRQEAKALTLQLYRACVRSVRHIRHGNALDEAEFQRREAERLDMLNDSSSSSTRSRMSNNTLSMLPPVDRDDELRSRAEYYLQYARDYFMQESACLDGEKWFQQRIARYRKWLLKDMGFDDPFVGLDEIRVELFQKNAQALVEQHGTTTTIVEVNPDDDDSYAWSDDEEDEEERHLPGWYKNAKSGGST